MKPCPLDPWNRHCLAISRLEDAQDSIKSAWKVLHLGSAQADGRAPDTILMVVEQLAAAIGFARHSRESSKDRPCRCDNCYTEEE